MKYADFTVFHNTAAKWPIRDKVYRNRRIMRGVVGVHEYDEKYGPEQCSS